MPFELQTDDRSSSLSMLLIRRALAATQLGLSCTLGTCPAHAKACSAGSKGLFCRQPSKGQAVDSAPPGEGCGKPKPPGDNPSGRTTLEIFSHGLPHHPDCALL
jgi:hypothetical protein